MREDQARMRLRGRRGEAARGPCAAPAPRAVTPTRCCVADLPARDLGVLAVPGKRVPRGDGLLALRSGLGKRHPRFALRPGALCPEPYSCSNSLMWLKLHAGFIAAENAPGSESGSPRGLPGWKRPFGFRLAAASGGRGALRELGAAPRRSQSSVPCSGHTGHVLGLVGASHSHFAPPLPVTPPHPLLPCNKPRNIRTARTFRVVVLTLERPLLGPQ